MSKKRSSAQAQLQPGPIGVFSHVASTYRAFPISHRVDDQGRQPLTLHLQSPFEPKGSSPALHST